MNQIPIKIELPDLVNKALSPLAEQIGVTLSAIWDITFGWIENSKEKIQYKRALSLEQFKESLTNGISQIPPENLCEPKISIIGPAMEASKYYFDEKELRDMFSNLIVRSLDSSKCTMVHPSFIEIIKQLSPNDALLLKMIFLKNNYLPAARLSICTSHGTSCHETSSHKRRMAIPIVAPLLVSSISENEQSVSINNFDRLGLITIVKYTLDNDTAYDFIKNTDLYSEALNEIQSINVSTTDSAIFAHVCEDRMALCLSPFGEAFCDVCL